MNALIVNAVNIGNNAVVGVGNIVTCDISPNEISVGNPVKFIRKRS